MSVSNIGNVLTEPQMEPVEVPCKTCGHGFHKAIEISSVTTEGERVEVLAVLCCHNCLRFSSKWYLKAPKQIKTDGPAEAVPSEAEQEGKA